MAADDKRTPRAEYKEAGPQYLAFYGVESDEVAGVVRGLSGLETFEELSRGVTVVFKYLHTRTDANRWMKKSLWQEIDSKWKKCESIVSESENEGQREHEEVVEITGLDTEVVETDELRKRKEEEEEKEREIEREKEKDKEKGKEKEKAKATDEESKKKKNKKEMGIEKDKEITEHDDECVEIDGDENNKMEIINLKRMIKDLQSRLNTMSKEYEKVLERIKLVEQSQVDMGKDMQKCVKVTEGAKVLEMLQRTEGSRDNKEMKIVCRSSKRKLSGWW
jgi:hypothetical protein